MKACAYKLQLKKIVLVMVCLTASMGLLSGCGNEAKAVNGAMDIDLLSLPTEMVDPMEWSDDPEAIYLLAKLPEEDIYLYGLGDKSHVLLRQGEQRALLDWEYITPRLILPEMHFADYDGDGGKELAVVLYVGSGTGVSIEELHIVNWRGAEAVDHLYQPQDYENQLAEQTQWSYDADNKKATLHCGYLDVYLLEGADTHYDEVEGIADFSSQVNFELTDDGKIKARFALGLLRPEQASPDYHGVINAEVSYRKGKFSMDPNTMIYKEEM